MSKRWLPIAWMRPTKLCGMRTLHRAFNERQQDDYMPFVEMDPDELKQLLESVRNMVNGISAYIRENA
ncbi:MAG: hypothetical protein M1376_06615 [Planctomycetes bacterium]|nr:hypothetical protein [Planctomycetota bacterium]